MGPLVHYARRNALLPDYNALTVWQYAARDAVRSLTLLRKRLL